MWESIVTNYKTTIAGIIAFLFTVPTFVTALQAWAAGQPVNWKQVLVSVAIAAVGGGLIAAKDASTHSTQAQVTQSTLNAEK